MHNLVTRTIVLLLSGRSRKTAHSISFEIGRKLGNDPDRILALAHKDNTPAHIPLYRVALPEASERSMMSAVGSVAAKHRLRHLDFLNVILFAGSYLLQELALSHELRALHTAIVRAVDPLRKNNIPSGFLPWLKSETPILPEQRHCLEEWGDPLAMSSFFPHVPLAHLASEEDANMVMEKLRHIPQTMTVRPTSVRIGTMNDSGFFLRSLQEYPLQPDPD